MKEIGKNVASIGGAIGIIAVFFTAGYSLGDYRTSTACDLDKIRLEREFQEKWQTIYKECQESKRDEYSLSVKELDQVIAELKKRGYGK